MTMLHLGDELKTRKTFQDCDHHYLVAVDSVNNLEKPQTDTQTDTETKCKCFVCRYQGESVVHKRGGGGRN
jgi:hypothetical protein